MKHMLDTGLGDTLYFHLFQNIFGLHFSSFKLASGVPFNGNLNVGEELYSATLNLENMSFDWERHFLQI